MFTEDVNASEEQAMIIDDDTLNWTGAEKEMDDKGRKNQEWSHISHWPYAHDKRKLMRQM